MGNRGIVLVRTWQPFPSSGRKAGARREPLGHAAGWALAPEEGAFRQGLAATALFLVICPQGSALQWHEG